MRSSPIPTSRLRLDLLATPAFLTALTLLLTNDNLLKPVLHNWVTGKISDFAGLFAFALFWIALAPRRPRLVLFSVGLGYAYWESGLSQPLIEAWNRVGIVSLGRSLDYTDLSALTVLPIVGRYWRSFAPLHGSRVIRLAIIPVALFAFVATSGMEEYTYDSRYEFGVSDVQLSRLIDENLNAYRSESGEYEIFLAESTPWPIFCSDVAFVRILGSQRGSVLILDRIYIHTAGLDGKACDRREALKVFEEQAISQLRQAVKRVTD
jgi:hypothetical protein